MNAKDRWKAANRVEILLPSGFRVAGIPPTPSEVVRLGLMPADLRMAVAKMNGRRFDSMSEEEHSQHIESRRYLTAAFIREMAAPGEDFEPTIIERDELVDLGADLEALDDYIAGYRTPAEITAASRRALGLTEAEPEKEPEAPPDERPADWAGFRDGPGGAVVRDDGSDVRDQAVGDDRNTRRANRARRRRGAVPAADVGESGNASPPA